MKIRNFADICNCLAQSSKSLTRVATILFGLVICLSLATVQLMAQTGGDGAIEGTVLDSTGAVVAGATVVATNVNTGAVTTRPTTKAGYYVISPLTPGTYSVTVTAKGFQVAKQDNMSIDAMRVSGLNVTLVPGSQTETITVTDTPPALETTNATQGGTIDNETYADLPIVMTGGQQRDITQFSNLLPGAQVPPGGRSSIINGTAQRMGELYVDGIPMTTIFAQGDNRPVFNIIPLESIDQIRVVTAGFSAEYQGAGMENYSLKSGTNTFHGAIFEYIRNTAFDSWTWASKGTGVKSVEHQNEYGATVGGPIRIPHVFDGRNKIFFYGSYDRSKYISGVSPQVSNLPTDPMRTGDFSALLNTPTNPNVANVSYTIYDPTSTNLCTLWSTNGPCRYAFGQTAPTVKGKAGNPVGTATNIIPTNEISPQTQYLQSFLPHANINTGTTPGYQIQSNYQGGLPTEFNNHLYSARIDYNISDKQKIFGAYSWGERVSHNPSGTQAGLPAPYNNSTNAVVGGYFAEFEHSYSITPNIVNEFKAGFVRFYSNTQNLALGDPRFAASAIGITGLPDGAASTQFPLASWSGSNTQTAWGGGSTATQVGNTYSYVDNLLWVKGKHAFTIGFQYQFLEVNQDAQDGSSAATSFGWKTNETAQPTPGSTTTFVNNTGYSYASYILGAVGSSGVTISPFSTLGGRYRPVAPYFQDDYKVTPKLTLNLGLRWDYLPTYQEVQDRWSFLNPAIINPITGNPGTLQTAGNWGGAASGPLGVSLGSHSPVKNYWKNFGPRLGFAYSVTPKLVARGGYALLYTHAGGTGGFSNAYNGTGQTGFNSSSNPIADSQTAPGFYLNGNPAFTVTTPTGTNVSATNSAIGGAGYTVAQPAAISAATQMINVGNFVCSGQAISQCSGTTGTFAGTGNAIAYADPYLGGRSPEIDFYNFGLQYELFSNLTIAVNYVGSQSHFIQTTSGARGLQSGQVDPKYLPLTNVGGTVNAVLQPDGKTVSTGGTNYLGLAATPLNVANAVTAYGAALPTPYAGYTAAAQATTQAPGVSTKSSSVTIGHMLTWMPQYSGTTDTYDDIANANYHALQASVQKQMSHGLSFTVNYTWSKNIDDAGTYRSGYAIPASATLDGRAWAPNRIDRSLSVNNVPNLLTVFGTYKLPFGKNGIGANNRLVRYVAGGWTLSSIYQYGSGLPLTITGTYDSANGAFGQGTAMPDINPNYHGNPRQNGKWGHGLSSSNIGGIRYVDGYIQVPYAGAGAGSIPNTTPVPCLASTGPFCNAGGGKIGNAPRVGAYGLHLDGQGRTSAHLSRTFEITQRFKFVFGADGTNLLNHTSYGNNSQNVAVGLNVNSANFGTVTTNSIDPRDFQFSGRITF